MNNPRTYRNPRPDLVCAAILAGFLSAGSLLADTFRVRHDHDPWGSCTGQITVGENGIEYRSDDKQEHSRQWTWLDIQTVDRRSPHQFTILTYQDQKWLLGQDRPWNFNAVDPGAVGLDDQLFSVIMKHLERPVVNRQAREIDPEYEVPVKHLHTFGGCEGVLQFSRDWVVYDTDHEKDRRSWRRDTEVANVWSTGPYDLEIEVHERDGGDLLRTRRFHFQLKRPLDQEYYSQLRRAMLPRR